MVSMLVLLKSKKSKKIKFKMIKILNNKIQLTKLQIQYLFSTSISDLFSNESTNYLIH